MWSDWPVAPDAAFLTPREAQARQDEARARKEWLTWFIGPVTAGGTVMARAHTADLRGGMFLAGALVAPTLNELRQMMPAGLAREERSVWDPADVIELWV